MSTDIYIINEIGQKGVTAAYVQDCLLKAKGDHLNIYIDSGGGEVFEGYTIANLIQNSGKKATAHIIGYCGSIATKIALACDEVIMNENSRFMIHNPWTKVEGDVHEIRKAEKELEKIKDELVNEYILKTKKSREEISAMMDTETSFTAQEALEFGFATSIKPRSKAVALIKPKHMEETQLVGKFSAFLDKLDKLINPKNEMPKTVLTTDGEFDIMIEAIEGEEVIGKETKKVVDGQVIEEVVPDGSYTLTDGRVVVITEGKIEAVNIVEAEDETKKELEAKEQELAEAKAEIESLKASVEEYTSTLKALKDEVSEIKNLTVGKNNFKSQSTPKTITSSKFFK